MQQSASLLPLAVASGGKATEYQEIHGYILVRKPSSMRVIGLFPILQNQMFDMVSSGQEFKLWIPPKNQLIAGNNDTARSSTQLLDNLRPQVIYDALLLQEVDPQNELAVLERAEHMGIDRDTQKPVLQADYALDIIKQNGQGWHLARKTVFDRADLLTARAGYVRRKRVCRHRCAVRRI